MITLPQLKAGHPHQLGPTVDAEGVNFAIYSAHAEKIELCLFSEDGSQETARLSLPERNDDVWHGFLPGAKPGLRYGYRAYGPYDPQNGHRFNPNKLLLDPYARVLDRPFAWDDRHCGYVANSFSDLSFDDRDNGAVAQKCVVAEAGRDWPGGPDPQVDRSAMVIYELHVRGQTRRHPGIPANQRGTFAGLAHPAMLDRLTGLGVTTVELLPVHPRITSQRLAQKGLSEYWGYNSSNFFALEPGFSSRQGVDEFRAMVQAFHAAGIEVILDVVFNHSGEGDHLGPTISFRGIDNASYYNLSPDKSRYVDFTGCKNSLNFDNPWVRRMAMDSLRYWITEMHVDGFRFDLAVSLAREEHHFRADARFLTCLLEDPILGRAKLIAEPWDLGPDGYQLGAFPPRILEWNDRFRDQIRRFWRGDGSSAEFAARMTGSPDIFPRRKTASVNYVTAHDGFTLEDLVSYSEKHNLANGENNQDGANENYSQNHGVEGKTSDAEIQGRRNRQKRNLIASLFLASGIPMFAAGDEFGRSQQGNNNAYCQDNELSWLDWDLLRENGAFCDFAKGMVALRSRFVLAGPDERDLPARRVAWLLPDGSKLEFSPDEAPVECFGARYSCPGNGHQEALLLVNTGNGAVAFALPEGGWKQMLDTAQDQSFTTAIWTQHCVIQPNSMLLLESSTAS